MQMMIPEEKIMSGIRWTKDPAEETAEAEAMTPAAAEPKQIAAMETVTEAVTEELMPSDLKNLIESLPENTVASIDLEGMVLSNG